MMRFFLLLRNFIANVLGFLVFNFYKKRRNIALENLRFAFPCMPEKQRRRIAKRSMQSLLLTYLEIMGMSKLTPQRLAKKVNVSDAISLINDVYSRNKGIVLLSGHLGNWELMIHAVGIYTDIPISIVVKPQSNHRVDAYMSKIRQVSGNKTINMYHAARAIINVVKNKEVLALLVDQAATEDKDVFVDFFGRPASTFKVIAELCIRYDIPLVMGFSVRQNDGKYKIRVREINFQDIKNDSDAVLKLTQRHVKELESVIRKYPEQWTWMHRRWKHTPPNN